MFNELLDNTNASDSYIQRCRKIIDKATMFDPNNRYADTGILLKALPALRRPKAGKRKVLLPILAIALIMLVVTFEFAMSRGRKNNVTTEGTHLHSNIETTPNETSGHTAEVFVNQQTTTEQPTASEVPTTTESETSTKQQVIKRFMLSYADVITEYYDKYEGIYHRICELNPSMSMLLHILIIPNLRIV